MTPEACTAIQHWASIATIVNAVASVIFLGVSAAVAVYLYRWHIDNTKTDTTRKLSEDLRHYNELVLTNEDLQSIAAANHRWGTLSKEDVVRMYRYFILLNISMSLDEARKRGAVDERVYDSQINNTANTTYADREFIKQHVLPRGYPVKFRELLISRWAKIDNDGTLPCV